MVECEYCHSSTSQRYIYTECNHFVCINCAALRSGETLMCCYKSTVLDEQVKTELAERKLLIMSNLQNEYQYEKNENNRESFQQIERKLNMINKIQDGKRTKRPLTEPIIVVKENNPVNMCNDDEIFIDNNHKAFQRSSYQGNVYHNAQTPIRLISNPSAIMQIQSDYGGSSQIRHSLSSNTNKPSNFKSQLAKMKQAPFSLQQFKPLLQTQLDFINTEFQTLHQGLKRIENELIINVKVYFEEYVKLIQKDYDLGTVGEESIVKEKERITAYLDAVIQQSKLHQLKISIIGGESSSMNPNNARGLEIMVDQKSGHNAENVQYQQQRLLSNEKKAYNHGNENQHLPLPLQSRRIENLEPRNRHQRHQGSMNKAPQSSESYFERLHLNTMRQHFNNVQIENIQAPPAASTNRNLDKIYRKLEESRTKLQERIQLHSEFVNKRSTRMSNI